jgi:hypothetical protein
MCSKNLQLISSRARRHPLRDDQTLGEKKEEMILLLLYGMATRKLTGGMKEGVYNTHTKPRERPTKPRRLPAVLSVILIAITI